MHPTKIVAIGAASAAFGTRIVDEAMLTPELRGSTLVLVDIDGERLPVMAAYASRLNEAFGAGLRIEHTTNRTEALPDAEFVFVSIAVNRNELWKLDFQIPLRHGIKQVYGENGGPGGLSHSLRNIPIVLDICRDVERLCPDALVLNFSNPEGRLCLAASRYTGLQFVGLCHGIGMAQTAIGQALDLPPDEIDPKAAGLNHFTWVLDLRRKSTGEDLYPAFKRAVAEKDMEEAGLGDYHWGVKLSRYLMETFGYWPSPSDDHVGEYLSYAWEYCGLEGYDFDAADRGGEELWQRLQRWGGGQDPLDSLLERRSGERAVAIIAGVLGNTHQYELAVNVPNAGLIPNLPAWAIVEVPATVDATGVHGVHVGPLPEPIAAMCRTQAAVIDRVVEAGVHGDRHTALEALLLDPVVTSISQAEAILDELLEVHKDFLPQF